MALYSSSYLKDLSRNTPSFQKSKLFSESKQTKTFDIFLSHSFLDKEEVTGLYIELTNQGLSVYVDWIIDSHLDRNNVTKATAELIRNRMKQSKSLLLAISTNAQMSKWMPWELGFVDGNTSKCAIIPVSSSIYAPKKFDRQEFLKLYPYIQKVPGLQNRLWVIDEEYKYDHMENWLRTGEYRTSQARNIFEL